MKVKKVETVNIWEENMGEYLYQLWLWTSFTRWLNKAQTKEKIDKFNYVKNKSFCSSKDSIKRQAINWKEIFATNVTDKDLVSWTYKDLLWIIKQKENN